LKGQTKTCWVTVIFRSGRSTLNTCIFLGPSVLLTNYTVNNNSIILRFHQGISKLVPIKANTWLFKRNFSHPTATLLFYCDVFPIWLPWQPTDLTNNHFVHSGSCLMSPHNMRVEAVFVATLFSTHITPEWIRVTVTANMNREDDLILKCDATMFAA